MSSPAGSLLDNRAAAALMAKLRRAAEHSDPLSGLSDQERMLLDLLGEGLTNKENAARILAEKTVKNYVSRLLAKLGMERRIQAAVFVSSGSIAPPPRGITTRRTGVRTVGPRSPACEPTRRPPS